MSYAEKKKAKKQVDPLIDLTSLSVQFKSFQLNKELFKTFEGFSKLFINIRFNTTPVTQYYEVVAYWQRYFLRFLKLLHSGKRVKKIL